MIRIDVEVNSPWTKFEPAAFTGRMRSATENRSLLASMQLDRMLKMRYDISGLGVFTGKMRSALTAHPSLEQTGQGVEFVTWGYLEEAAVNTTGVTDIRPLYTYLDAREFMKPGQGKPPIENIRPWVDYTFGDSPYQLMKGVRRAIQQARIGINIIQSVQDSAEYEAVLAEAAQEIVREAMIAVGGVGRSGFGIF